MMSSNSRVTVLCLIAICGLLAGCGQRDPAERPATHSQPLWIPGWQTALSEYPTRPAFRRLSQQRLMAHVNELADPRYNGRRAFTADSRAAAWYVADQFELAGLFPTTTWGYLQRFSRKSGTAKGDQNVIGEIPGCGFKHLLVAAHYDHLGRIGGQLHPGADDNATGVAAMIEVARVLQGRRFQRTILFVAFGAEEIGQLGAWHYLENPVYPLSQLTLMVNLDMIGRGLYESQLGSTITMGIALVMHLTPQALISHLKQRAKLHGLSAIPVGDDLVEQFGIGFSYDSRPFNETGLPTLFLSTSIHPDYHRPTDTADRVNPLKVYRVAKLLLDLVLEQAGPPCEIPTHK